MISITKEQLNLAGWLSITNAVITIPIFVLSIFLVSTTARHAKAIQVVLTLVSLGLFIRIFWSPKELLNSRFQFHGVDLYISLLIGINIAISILSFLAMKSNLFEWAMNILSTMALMAQGIILIMFATRLLRLPENLYGLLKPYSHITIVSGICAITIILFWAAIIAGAVTDVILGIIFFRAAGPPPRPPK